MQTNGFLQIIVPSFRGSGPGSGTGMEPVRDPFGPCGTLVWDAFGTGSPAAVCPPAFSRSRGRVSLGAAAPLPPNGADRQGDCGGRAPSGNF